MKLLLLALIATTLVGAQAYAEELKPVMFDSLGQLKFGDLEGIRNANQRSNVSMWTEIEMGDSPGTVNLVNGHITVFPTSYDVSPFSLEIDDSSTFKINPSTKGIIHGILNLTASNDEFTTNWVFSGIVEPLRFESQGEKKPVNQHFTEFKPRVGNIITINHVNNSTTTDEKIKLGINFSIAELYQTIGWK